MTFEDYQPGWTLVGGGIKTADQVRREQRSLIPKGVQWLKTRATEFDPENNRITLQTGQRLNYDFLVMATGIESNFDQVKGLREALKTDENVVSMYSHANVQRVFPAIKNFRGGNAIFTFPKMPIKCPGAPQKIMYLAEDYFRKVRYNQKMTKNLGAFLGFKILFQHLSFRKLRAIWVEVECSSLSDCGLICESITILIEFNE